MNTSIARRAIHGQGAAAKALEVARRRGMTVPKEIARTERTLENLDEISRTANPAERPPLPADPAKIEAAVRAAATRRTTAAETQTVVAELLPQSVSAFVQAVADGSTPWIEELADAFELELMALRSVAPIAPNVPADRIRTLSGESAAAWHSFVQSASALDALVQDRQVLAEALAEPWMSEWGRVFVAALAPPKDNESVKSGFTPRALSLKDTDKETDQQTRWRSWLEYEASGWLRLSLARPHELGPRVSLVNVWRQAFDALSSRDSGAFDKALQSGHALWRPLAIVRSPQPAGSVH